MIYVDETRCTGCAACVGVCLHGAIAMQDGIAIIAGNLCTDCRECLDVCPHGAIVLVEPVTANALQIPPNRALLISQQSPQRLQPSVGQKLMPIAQAALLWAGREVLPRLANLALEWIDSRQALQTPLRSPLDQTRRTTVISTRTSRVGNAQRRRERRRQRGAGR